MEEFSRLTQQQHTQQHQQSHKLPKWFSPNILRYYVLVHDVTEQAEAKYVLCLISTDLTDLRLELAFPSAPDCGHNYQIFLS